MKILIVEDERWIVDVFKEQFDSELACGKAFLVETCVGAFEWIKAHSDDLGSMVFFLDWTMPMETGDITERIGHEIANLLIERYNVEASSIYCISGHPAACKEFPRGIRFCEKNAVRFEVDKIFEKIQKGLVENGGEEERETKCGSKECGIKEGGSKESDG